MLATKQYSGIGRWYKGFLLDYDNPNSHRVRKSDEELEKMEWDMKDLRETAARYDQKMSALQSRKDGLSNKQFKLEEDEIKEEAKGSRGYSPFHDMIDDVFQFILDYLHTSNNLIGMAWVLCLDMWNTAGSHVYNAVRDHIRDIKRLVSLFRAGDGTTRQKGIYGDGNDYNFLLLNIEVYIPV